MGTGLNPSGIRFQGPLSLSATANPTNRLGKALSSKISPKWRVTRAKAAGGLLLPQPAALASAVRRITPSGPARLGTSQWVPVTVHLLFADE